MSMHQLLDHLSLLGVPRTDFEAAVRGDSLAEVERRLAELHTRARAGFRKLATVLHPDVTGGDPEKAATYARLSASLSELAPPHKQWVPSACVAADQGETHVIWRAGLAGTVCVAPDER